MTRILELFEEKNFSSIKGEFENSNPVDIATQFEEIENNEQAIVLFKLIPKDLASEVFVYLSPEKQQWLVERFSDREVANVLKDLFIDDAVALIEEMPANMVERLLKNASPETRHHINTILNYPENSAGSLMTIEFVDLKSNMTVKQAFDRIRKIGTDKETINTCYVTDSKRVLEGVLSVRDLLLAEPDQTLHEIMNTHAVSVQTHTDQEEIANVFSKYDLTALPVLDQENRLVGIITVDDIIDIIHEEATEDFHKMAAIAPNEEEYLKTSVFTHAWKRIGWLLILMLSSMVTGSIINTFEASILLIPALVSFIPMLMDTAGNSGSQTSTLIIRGMAMGEVKMRDFFKVFYKEFRVSLLVGLILAIFNFVRILIINQSFMLAITVSSTIYLTVVVAKCVGFMLPMFAKKVKLDPALMAAPLITTIVDTISVSFYFLIASAVFGL